MVIRYEGYMPDKRVPDDRPELKEDFKKVYGTYPESVLLKWGGQSSVVYQLSTKANPNVPADIYEDINGSSYMFKFTIDDVEYCVVADGDYTDEFSNKIVEVKARAGNQEVGGRGGFGIHIEQLVREYHGYFALLLYPVVDL